MRSILFSGVLFGLQSLLRESVCFWQFHLGKLSFNSHKNDVLCQSWKSRSPTTMMWHYHPRICTLKKAPNEPVHTDWTRTRWTQGDVLTGKIELRAKNREKPKSTTCGEGKGDIYSVRQTVSILVCKTPSSQFENHVSFLLNQVIVPLIVCSLFKVFKIPFETYLGRQPTSLCPCTEDLQLNTNWFHCVMLWGLIYTPNAEEKRDWALSNLLW